MDASVRKSFLSFSDDPGYVGEGNGTSSILMDINSKFTTLTCFQFCNVTVYVCRNQRLCMYVAEKLSPVLLDIARYVEPVDSERLGVLLGHGISIVANLLGILVCTLCTPCTAYNYLYYIT